MSEPQALWELTAGELASGYAGGAFDPLGVLEAVLARHDAVNPQLNAVVTLDRGGARGAAGESAARWHAGTPLSALDGVPLTVKDNILVAGMRATWGSRIFADFVPERDETPVARLRAAGAVILGKTNVPEFTVQGITDNPLFGPTRNPRNPALTPGGSSGGAVAAVASGIGPLALCTDGGGSIRRPAAHTGLLGLKPSRALVPRRDGFPAILHDFEVAGPIGRNAADVLALLRIIARAGSIQAEPMATAPCRIGFIPQFGDAPVDGGIADSVAMAADALASLGHSVKRLDDFKLADPVNAIWPIISETGVAWLLDAHGDAIDVVGADVAALAMRGRMRTARSYLDALQTIALASAAFDDLFTRFEVLLTPTTAAQAWSVGVAYPDLIAGVPVGPRGHAVFTAFANALGLPALSMPGCPDADGLPVGIQLCGPIGADDRLLAIAGQFEHLDLSRYRSAKGN